MPGPGQDKGEVPKENSTEGSWAVTENKVCFTICSWHRFIFWRKILSSENSHIITDISRPYYVWLSDLPPITQVGLAPKPVVILLSKWIRKYQVGASEDTEGMGYFPITLYTSSNSFSPSSWTPSIKGGTASEAAEKLVVLHLCLGTLYFVSMLLENILAIYTNVHTLSSTPVSGFQKNNFKKGNNYMHKAVHSNIWTRATAYV